MLIIEVFSAFFGKNCTGNRLVFAKAAVFSSRKRLLFIFFRKIRPEYGQNDTVSL